MHPLSVSVPMQHHPVIPTESYMAAAGIWVLAQLHC